MALRIPTGIIVTSALEGRATVNFSPHDVEGQSHGVDLFELGPDREYRATPGTMVALRELSSETAGSAKIDHPMQTTGMLEISRKGVDEFTYIVVGEVDE